MFDHPVEHVVTIFIATCAYRIKATAEVGLTVPLLDEAISAVRPVGFSAEPGIACGSGLAGSASNQGIRVAGR